jgi:hypothetical protein
MKRNFKEVRDVTAKECSSSREKSRNFGANQYGIDP